MGQKATQAFNNPENRQNCTIPREYGIKISSWGDYDIEELCATAHFNEAIDDLRNTRTY
jgi:hypothetical protein